MTLTTCPKRDQTSDQAPASQPVRAPAAPAACQCHRCAKRAALRGAAGDDLDAYIADLAERAPPLTGEQRDKLALLLDHRCSTVPGIRAPAA